MANHITKEFSIRQLSEGGIDFKVVEFIKENNLPFLVDGFDNDEGYQQVFKIHSDAEYRRSHVLKGIHFGDEDATKLEPFLIDAKVVYALIDECNGGPIQTLIFKDGEVVYEYTEVYDMGLDINSENMHTPKDYQSVHYWDTDEYRNKKTERDNERHNKRMDRIAEEFNAQIADGVVQDIDENNFEALVKKYVATYDDEGVYFTSFAMENFSEELRQKVANWVFENKPEVAGHNLPF